VQSHVHAPIYNIEMGRYCLNFLIDSSFCLYIQREYHDLINIQGDIAMDAATMLISEWYSEVL
jgi:hypothetical protein